MSAFSSTGNALKDENDVTGQIRTPAPQQAAPYSIIKPAAILDVPVPTHPQAG
jgi:hypothetical protein